MTLTERFADDLKRAMKARDADRVSVLRMVLSELRKEAIDRGAVLGEPEEVAIVQKAIKQRHEAAEGFTKGGRPERAEQEKAEAVMLQAYMPAALGDDELRAAIAQVIQETGATTAKDVGRVMGPLLKRCAGRVDGNRARQAVLLALGG